MFHKQQQQQKNLNLHILHSQGCTETVSFALAAMEKAFQPQAIHTFNVHS